MQLSNLKPTKQRTALERIANQISYMAHNGSQEDVEIFLEHIQMGVLDELGQHDFFGPEGWESFFNLTDL